MVAVVAVTAVMAVTNYICADPSQITNLCIYVYRIS